MHSMLLVAHGISSPPGRHPIHFTFPDNIWKFLFELVALVFIHKKKNSTKKYHSKGENEYLVKTHKELLNDATMPIQSQHKSVPSNYRIGRAK
jgi:hypothetical protein